MQDKAFQDNIVDKLINIEDKFIEIESIVKMINIWVKERDYELIPILNILNDRINSVSEIIKK